MMQPSLLLPSLAGPGLTFLTVPVKSLKMKGGSTKARKREGWEWGREKRGVERRRAGRGGEKKGGRERGKGKRERRTGPRLCRVRAGGVDTEGREGEREEGKGRMKGTR